MKGTLLISVVLLLCNCCAGNEGTKVKPVRVSESINVIMSDDSLHLDRDTVDLTALDEYKFGDFFLERASFFAVPNPDMKILEAQVTELVVFCLDGLPRKQKYFLDKDVSDEFINRYRCRIIPRDRKNREIVKAEGAFRKENGGFVINNRLDNFDLVGLNGRMKVRLAVQNNISIFTEESVDYESQLKRIEAAAY